MPSYVPVDELIGGAILGKTSVNLPGYSTPQSIIVPVEGAQVDVYQRGTLTHVDCFTDQHGAGAPVVQPLTTNADGQVVESGGSRVYTAQPAELDVGVQGGGLPGSRTLPVGQALIGRAALTEAYAAAITPALPVSGQDVLVEVATLTGNVTINNPTGTPEDGQVLTIRLAQDATGGRTVAYGTAFVFSTDAPAALDPTTASAKWRRMFQWNAATSKWEGLAVARGF